MKLLAIFIFLLSALYADNNATTSQASKNSPSALASLTQEHEKVNETHKAQLQTIKTSIELEKYILLEREYFLFELSKNIHLLHNDFLINNEKIFLKDTQ